MTCVAFSIKFVKTNQKFAENSEFCETYSLLFKIIHWCPYTAYRTRERLRLLPSGVKEEALGEALTDFCQLLPTREVRSTGVPEGRPSGGQGLLLCQRCPSEDSASTVTKDTSE